MGPWDNGTMGPQDPIPSSSHFVAPLCRVLSSFPCGLGPAKAKRFTAFGSSVFDKVGRRSVATKWGPVGAEDYGTRPDSFIVPLHRSPFVASFGLSRAGWISQRQSGAWPLNRRFSTKWDDEALRRSGETFLRTQRPIVPWSYSPMVLWS